MDGQTLFNFGLVVLFVLVGGVFAATEIALVSLRESQLVRLEQRGTRGARVAAVARDPNRFLAAVQIGVTVAGFFSAAYGGSTLAPDIAPALAGLGIPEAAAETSALVLMTLMIAYLSLVLGELVPKRLALQRSADFALVVAPPLDRFAVLMRPVIALLSVSTNTVVRLVGGDPGAAGEELSKEELRDIVSTHEGLDEQERRILSDVLAARESTLREVMRPRGDVEFVRATMPLAEARALLRQSAHSRFPVTGEDFDDVSGFLHVRDLLNIGANDSRRVEDVQREIITLPSTNRVLPTVSLMRQRGVHLALVVDEYGGTDGIVTLEDLVEEIVGDIRDEYDDPDPGVRDRDLVDAGLSIADFKDATGIELPDGDYETAAGYVIGCLGRIPEVGDSVDLDPRTRLEVADMVGMRITELRVDRTPQPDSSPTDEPRANP